jgi:hypothetical protein
MRALTAQKLYALAATPLLWAAWFYLYVVRQRIHLGFWPQPSHPDPKNAGYVLHHLSIYFGVLLVPILAVAAAGLAIQKRTVDASFRWWLVLSLVTFSLACYLAVMFVDPGRYWIWFRD